MKKTSRVYRHSIANSKPPASYRLSFEAGLMVPDTPHKVVTDTVLSGAPTLTVVGVFLVARYGRLLVKHS